jgi:hypothetical protein
LYDARNDPAAPGLRLILCGSSLSVMTGLLPGQKPLRGRAPLDLGLAPFDFRESARFRAAGATLALFSQSGFDRRLRAAASGRADVLLVDLAHLYGVR